MGSDKAVSYKDIKRWYLEMTTRPAIEFSPPDGIEILSFSGDCAHYRELNRLIGADLGWVDRQLMSDAELLNILQNPDIKIWVIYHLGLPIGYTELDFTDTDEVILEYFGIGQAARGKGFGKLLLQWTITEAWKFNPLKLKLHTSDQDHPNALPNYLKAGFKVVDERVEKQAVIL